MERAADEIDGARLVERREQRAVKASFLAVQSCLEGALTLYGELDSVAGPTVLGAIEAASDPPVLERGEPGQVTKRARQRAQGLERVCREYLGGGLGRPARPLLLAHLGVSNATATAAGTVELVTPRGAAHPERRPPSSG